MFNKENNKIIKIEMQTNNLYKQYDNIYITNSFIKMLNDYYISRNMHHHLDFDQKLKLYKDNVFLLNEKKQYNTIIVNLYHNGKLLINNTLYDVNDFYIVYNQNSKDYHVLCTNSNYSNEDINYNTAVKLIDTTVFIELIKNNEIKENTIIIKNNKLLETINNWDGLLHNEVCETDAIINKDMLGND